MSKWTDILMASADMRAGFTGTEQAMRQCDSVAEHHARELAHWKAHCDALTKLLADRAALTPPPVILADKESFEAGRILGTRGEREACAKACDLVAREVDDTNGTATYCAAAIRARGAA